MIFLGLGSNLGDRPACLNAAAAGLYAILSRPVFSSVYESRAILPENAPDSWDRNFLNAVVAGESDLAPRDLLRQVKALERQLGRTARKAAWAPREIDIDILACHDRRIDEAALTIPHRHMLERPFVLWPLADIAPEWRHPGTGAQAGTAARELAQRFGLRYPEDAAAPGNASGTWRTTLILNQP